MTVNMNIDVTQCIAEIVATGFSAARPALRRYSVTVVLHSPDRFPTRRCTGYGEDAVEARHNSISAGLKAWGWTDLDRMDVVDDIRVSSRTLPAGYGMAYLQEAYACAECANRLPAESQARRDIWAVAAAYERQYLAERYAYLCSR